MVLQRLKYVGAKLWQTGGQFRKSRSGNGFQKLARQAAHLVFANNAVTTIQATIGNLGCAAYDSLHARQS